MLSARNKPPFTASQWQELEHQALIYKYMVSGVPVPPELLYSVKLSLDSSSTRHQFPHQPIGWGGCFQVGYGKKADPEPGRCRRTDGKKWRCSKEAYGDSKYCERHMHRGRNRSRKPVESSATTTTAPTATPIVNYAHVSKRSSTLDPELIAAHHQIPSSHNIDNAAASFANPYIYTSSSSRQAPPLGSASASHHNLFLDSASHVDDRDYRSYFIGERSNGAGDERTFFPETSSTTSRAMNVSSLHDPYASSYERYPSSSSTQPQFQNFVDSRKQHQHCFVLGADFKSPTSSETSTSTIKSENDQAVRGDTHSQQHPKPLHHFFHHSWLDLASNTSRDD